MVNKFNLIAWLCIKWAELMVCALDKLINIILINCAKDGAWASGQLKVL